MSGFESYGLLLQFSWFFSMTLKRTQWSRSHSSLSIFDSHLTILPVSSIVSPATSSHPFASRHKENLVVVSDAETTWSQGRPQATRLRTAMAAMAFCQLPQNDCSYAGPAFQNG